MGAIGVLVRRDVGRDVSAIASPSLAVSFLVLLLLAGTIAWWLFRSGRTDRPVAWFGGLASLALVVAVTIFREGWVFGFDPSLLTRWSSNGWERLSGDPVADSQILLNVALFVPAGVTWTLVTRRPGRTLAALAALALLVECVQGVTGAGAPDVADVVANGAGGAVGVGAAHLGTRGRGRGSAAGSPPRRWLAAVAVVTGLVILVGAWQVGASRRQASVLEALELAFTGTDRTEVEAWLAGPDGPQRVFGAAPEWADGTRTTAEAFEVRYPATFFSLHRCVFATWTAASVSFRTASGDECADILG